MEVALPLASLGLSGAGTAVSAYGQSQAGKEAKRIGRMNARLVEMDTLDEMEQSRESFEILMSKQRSLYAKAGVDPNSGSPLLIYLDTAMKFIKDQKNIKKRGKQEADIYRAGGAAQARAYGLGTTTTILTGIGQGLLGGYQIYKGQS